MGAEHRTLRKRDKGSTMAQDVGQRDYSDEPEQQRSSMRSWVALATVVILVVLFLWLYWRAPAQSSMKSLTGTDQTPVTLPSSRPEPTIPAPASSPADSSTTRLVPDVLGNPRSSAIRTLEDAGYVVSSSEVYSTSKASGLVIGQKPGGGASLDRGSQVAIVISVSNRDISNVEMPDIVGLEQAAAESKVQAAGLTPYLTYGNSGVPEGHVISQWPLPGEMVPEGSQGLIQVQLSR
jgi:hypothetical protein